MRNYLRKIKEKVKNLIIIVASFFSVERVYADDLMNNKITTGLIKLLKDASTWIISIATVGIIVVISWNQFRKKWAEDEMEAKQFDKKTKASLIAYIIVICASTIVAVLSSYFK